MYVPRMPPRTPGECDRSGGRRVCRGGHLRDAGAVLDGVALVATLVAQKVNYGTKNWQHVVNECRGAEHDLKGELIANKRALWVVANNATYVHSMVG